MKPKINFEKPTIFQKGTCNTYYCLKFVYFIDAKISVNYTFLLT